MKRKGISLIGMPASGKSTIGRELSRTLDMPLLDIDKWMEEHEGMPLKQAIVQKGAAYILALESRCVRELDLHETIVSTPGSIIYNDVVEPLRQQTNIVWLNVPYGDIEQRLAPDVHNERGIIGLAEKGLQLLYEERLPLYRRWAQYTIDCTGKRQQEITQEITNLFGN